MRSAAWLTFLIATVSVGSACSSSVPPRPPASAPAPPPIVGCARRHPGQGAARPSSAPKQGSAVALVELGDATLAYVADADADVLRTIDVESGLERSRTALGGSPAQVLVLADGRVAVTLRDKNRVQLLEPEASLDRPLAPLCSVATPSEPFGLAATDDDGALLVTSAWAKKLTALDAGTLGTRFEVDLPREPRAVVVDGERAFVAHVVGAQMSVVDLAEGKHEVRAIDLRVKKLGDGKTRGGCQGFALAKSIDAEKPTSVGEKPLAVGPAAPEKRPTPTTGRVFAPMVTVDPGEPTTKTSGYGSAADVVAVESPMVSVVDADAERAMTRSLIHDGKRHEAECVLPRAAASGPDGALFVTCLGIDALIEMDARGLDPTHIERRRWPMPSGPTGLAIDAKHRRAIVWAQFDHELAVASLAGDDDASPRVLGAFDGGSKISPAMAWGRRLFHRSSDRRIASDGRACASCHPDGREDALTWSTPDGPRQTIMLAGRVASTAPYGWMGVHEDLKVHITSTFKRLGGSGLPDAADRFDDLDALVAYVREMPGPTFEGAVMAPHQAELAERGRELFFAEQQGCAGCHVGGDGTDQAAHEVGSSTGVDKKVTFDTPALRFVGGTAPYFHDGRFATLDELLRGSDGKMGHTLELSRRDVDALKAYLETL